jgi:hypothetical protein
MAHAESTGDVITEDFDAILTDLLADLRHRADAHGVDWATAASSGLYHYSCESK